MVEKKTDTKKTATPEGASKAASTKKAPVKKVAAKKTAANSTATTTSRTPPAQKNVDILKSIKVITDEMRLENVNRDKQITSLVQEIRLGFNNHSEQSDKYESEHEKEMTKLYQSLQNTFSKADESDSKREDRSMMILKALSDSIMKDHEQTLKEVLEQEKLQDKKFKHLTKVEEQRAGRNRWIAIPGMIIGITAIIYMFYVVTIMESAMTSMSRDMHEIQFAVVNMSTKMDGMSQNTGSMDTNMQQLNRNIGQMSQDLNILTYNVSPAMKGMRDMMPWSP